QRYDADTLSLSDLQRHGADAHLLALDAKGAPSARCSLWWNNVPQLPDQKPGLIGHFESRDDSSSLALLTTACDELKTRGRTLAIAPIDGSTWNRYRLVTDFGTQPPFFLEPINPPQYPGHFTSAGFTSLATYSSALNTNLSFEDPKIETIRRRMHDAGIHIRPINPHHFDAELKRIYLISAIAFRRNYLYTPVSEEDFLSQYARIRPVLQGELVLIAEQDARPVGFMFGLSDMLARAPNAPQTVILKTLAVLPERTKAGLGGLLIAECQNAARRLGYTRSIFALMHDSNASRSISSRYATPMRRYTLFGKPL
ncbi:MAG TPA: GNAT family N-acetyltransferase, partial [Tepidisphaeraceae bacterium]|nr:GNAT family N-acetyltransferase [Tepidisphaeraceae bacterium]